MNLDDIRRRLAALEQTTQITRLCVAFPAPEGAEFFGFRVTPFENLKPDEFFDVHGADRVECAARATAMANQRWLERPLLVVAFTPITEPQTEVVPDETSH